RPFTADDAIWNLKHVLDPATGSSSYGLMKDYLVNERKEGDKTIAELWDANALEKVDDFAFKMHLKTPQVAVPEHVSHYTNTMLDPQEGGLFAPDSNGTGPFQLVALEIQKRAALKPVQRYWGAAPHVDSFEFIDLRDDPAAQLDALASKQVQGLLRVEPFQIDAVRAIGHVELYTTVTAETATFAMKVTQEPWSDPRVRRAMKLAVDNRKVLDAALRGNGLAAENHHACPVHPEYAKLPPLPVDLDEARRLLAEAGHPDGIDAEVHCMAEPQWQA